jgi:hypothetical protein
MVELQHVKTAALILLIKLPLPIRQKGRIHPGAFAPQARLCLPAVLVFATGIANKVVTRMVTARANL